MRLSLLLIFIPFIVGCGGGNRVVVVDPKGTPITGAAIVPASLSFNGSPTFTNAKGEASVQLNGVQEVKWIDIRKSGYKSQFVPVPSKWPMKIVLEPATPPTGTPQQ